MAAPCEARGNGTALCCGDSGSTHKICQLGIERVAAIDLCGKYLTNVRICYMIFGGFHLKLLASYDIGKSGGNLIKKRSKEAAPTYKPFLAGVWNENARKNRTGCISSDVSFWVKNIKHGAIWVF